MIEILLLLGIAIILISLNVYGQYTPVYITGCTNKSDMISCNGTLIGEILNTSLNIHIHDATIQSVRSNLNISSLNISSGGFVNISSTTFIIGNATKGIDAPDNRCSGLGKQGGNGSSGILYIFSNNFVSIVNSSVTINGSDGGIGGDESCDTDPVGGIGGTGGDSVLYINGTELIINNTNLTMLAGQGGRGGNGVNSPCSANDRADGGDGGKGGNINITFNIHKFVIENFWFTHVSAGGGGKGYDVGSAEADKKFGGDSGIGGSFFFDIKTNMSTVNNQFINFSINKSVAGNAGQRGSPNGDGCGGTVEETAGAVKNGGDVNITWEGNSFSFIKAKNLTINFSAGNIFTGARSGLSYINIKVNSTFEVDENYTFSVTSPKNASIFNFTTTNIPRLKFNFLHFIDPVNIFCGSILNKLIFFTSNIVVKNLSFNECPNYYNTTSIDEYNQPFTFFENNLSNASLIHPTFNESASFRIDIRDNIDISFFMIGDNRTGKFINYSVVNYTTIETNISYVYNFTVNLTRGKRIAIMVWANDSQNWINTSDTYYFDVANTLPIVNNVSITELPISIGDDLKGHGNFTDIDLDSTGGNETLWYVNKTMITTANNSFTLKGGNATLNANITFSIRYNDTFNSSEWVNSTSPTVGDSVAPTIINQSINGNSFTTTDKVNVTLTCTDSGEIINVKVEHNGTGTYSNSTAVLLGNSIYSYNALFGLGKYNVTNLYCADSSGNIARDASNFTFTVSTAGGGGSSGGGGGGGGAQSIIQINQTNVTISNCNQNRICEAANGEDPFGCPTDCKINLNYITCDDPTQRCIKDLFDVKNKAVRFAIVGVILAIMIIALPEDSSLGKLIKKKRVK